MYLFKHPHKTQFSPIILPNLSFYHFFPFPNCSTWQESMLEVVIGPVRKMLLYAWHEFLLAKMVQLAQIKIKRFCGIKSLQSFKKTTMAAGGTVVVFIIGGTLWKGSLE